MLKLWVLIFSLFCSTCFAQPTFTGDNAPLAIASGAVVYYPWKIVLPDSVYTNNPDGSGTINLIGGGYLVNPMNALGDIIYGGAGGTPTRYGIGAVNTVLHANGTPQWSQVVEGDISLSNVVTNNANVIRHGFLPTISGDPTQFLNGAGNFATPAGVANSYLSQAFTTVATVSVVHNFGAKPVVQVIGSGNEVFIPNKVVHDTNNTFYVNFSTATSGIIVATVGSPQPQSLVTINSNYNILTSDYFIKATTLGLTMSLPVATGNVGRVFIVDNDTTGTCAVVALGSGLIEGETIQTLPGDSAMAVYCDGVGYRIY